MPTFSTLPFSFWDISLGNKLIYFFLKIFIYLFMIERKREREREREAETQAEGEAGSMQGV